MSAQFQDVANQAWYADRGSVAGMASQSGFTDEGERAAYRLLSGEMSQRPILDLGVGPGRTVSLLRAISADYVGLDYLPVMVDAALVAHPDADVRVGDARDLMSFADESKALVVFSYHGIDSVSHDDRRTVLAQAWRVLAPGGLFWFSTLNAQGPAARYRPWRMSGAFDRAGSWPGWLKALAKAVARMPVHTWRYGRARLRSTSGPGWMVAPFFAGGWQLVTHYTTLSQALDELQEAGFDPAPAVFEDAKGRRVDVDDDLRGVFGFNIVARKPASAQGLELRQSPKMLRARSRRAFEPRPRDWGDQPRRGWHPPLAR